MLPAHVLLAGAFAWTGARDREGRRALRAWLKTLRDTLGGCIGCGCLWLKRCALRNLGDVLCASSAGAPHLQVVHKRVSSRSA